MRVAANLLAQNRLFPTHSGRHHIVSIWIRHVTAWTQGSRGFTVCIYLFTCSFDLSPCRRFDLFSGCGRRRSHIAAGAAHLAERYAARRDPIRYSNASVSEWTHVASSNSALGVHIRDTISIKSYDYCCGSCIVGPTEPPLPSPSSLSSSSPSLAAMRLWYRVSYFPFSSPPSSSSLTREYGISASRSDAIRLTTDRTATTRQDCSHAARMPTTAPPHFSWKPKPLCCSRGGQVHGPRWSMEELRWRCIWTWRYSIFLALSRWPEKQA